MLRLAADENLNNDIIRGLLRRKPDLDIVRVQDAGLSGEADPTILDWCANNNRVLLTHDVSTMTKHAYERVAASKPMRAFLRSGVTFNLARQLKTFSYLRNTVLRKNGKDRFANLPFR